MYTFNMKSWIFFILFTLMNLNIFSLWGNFWSFVSTRNFLGRCGNKHFDLHFWRIRPVHFPSNDGKEAAYESKGMERCLFPARIGIFSFILDMIKVLVPISTLTWRSNNYVSRHGKGINRRNESSFFEKIPTLAINWL